MGLRDTVNKMFNVNQDNIKKMANVDIASGGVLVLPEEGQSKVVRIVSAPKLVQNDKLKNKDGALSVRCVLYGHEAELQYDMWISSTIYKGILAEFMKAKIPVDEDLKCMVGRIFCIAGKKWDKAPKEMWKIDPATKMSVPPKTYIVSLRVDLEVKIDGPELSNGNLPEIMRI